MFNGGLVKEFTNIVIVNDDDNGNLKDIITITDVEASSIDDKNKK